MLISEKLTFVFVPIADKTFSFKMVTWFKNYLCITLNYFPKRKYSTTVLKYKA